MYEPRVYRDFTSANNLKKFEVVADETDLFILVDKNLKNITLLLVKKYRAQITGYIKKLPQFQFALHHCNVDANIPLIVKKMAKGSAKVEVGY